MFLTNTCTFASISLLFQNFIKFWTGFNWMFKICKTRKQVSIKTGYSEKATQYYSWVQFKQLQKKDLGIIRGFWGGVSNQWNLSALGHDTASTLPGLPSPAQWAWQWLLDQEERWQRPWGGHSWWFHKHPEVQLHCLTTTHARMKVTQLCPTPSDPMDCSLPGSSIHGICQTRVLEWVAIAFSDLTSLGIKKKKCQIK